MLLAVSDVDRKRRGMPTRINHGGKQYITVRACQGPGKTFGIALLAHVFGFAYDPCVIVVAAPKLDHIKTRFMGEFQKIQHRAISGYASLMDVRATSVQWHTAQPLNHQLIAETGKQPENIQGLRRRYTLYLVDESSGVEEKFFPVMSGNINATELGIVVLIGNPTRITGTFADSHLKASLAHDYHRMHIGPQHSRRVKKADVERLERLYGKDSDITRVRAYGEFPLADANQLIPLEWLEAARLREAGPDGSIPKLRVTCDVADGGLCETVCSAALHYQSKIVFLRETRHSFPAHESPIMAAKAARQLFIDCGGNPANGDDLVIDADGVGSGTAGWLISEEAAKVNGLPLNVIAYRGGHASDNPKLWRNRRVQSHLVMRNRYRDGLVAYAEHYTDDYEGLFGQITLVKRKLGTGRVEDIVSKQELIDQGLASPDRSDAQAMQFATQAPRLSIGHRHMPAAPEIVFEPSTILDGLM